jgi:hypothetical protein
VLTDTAAAVPSGTGTAAAPDRTSTDTPIPLTLAVHVAVFTPVAVKSETVRDDTSIPESLAAACPVATSPTSVMPLGVVTV